MRDFEKTEAWNRREAKMQGVWQAFDIHRQAK